jgi:hypothetical protein
MFIVSHLCFSFYNTSLHTIIFVLLSGVSRVSGEFAPEQATLDWPWDKQSFFKSISNTLEYIAFAPIVPAAQTLTETV